MGRGGGGDHDALVLVGGRVVVAAADIHVGRAVGHKAAQFEEQVEDMHFGSDSIF